MFLGSAVMENFDLDWPDGYYVLNYRTHEPLTSDSLRVGLAAERASTVAEQAEQPSGEQYNKNNPEFIHYDFQWKVSQRENIRAGCACADTDPDFVLAPSDFWKANFQD